MRSVVLLAAAALILAFTVTSGALLRHTEAENINPTAITDCAQTMGAAVQGESCNGPSLDSPPGSVISHTVLARACAGADLHVVRYAPAGRASPLIATYCG